MDHNDNDIGLKSVTGVETLAELCELIEDNNKTLAWILTGMRN